MSLESLILDSGVQATITAEAPEGQEPAQDLLGAVDRSAGNWVPVVADVPCLLRVRSSTINYAHNDARANLVDARIYFLADPSPSGLSTRHRVTVTQPGLGGPRVVGVYAVLGVVDPNSLGRVFQVDCSRVAP